MSDVDVSELSAVIRALIDESCETAREKGWWGEQGQERTFGDLIALCHSELSEALEEFRSGHQPRFVYWQKVTDGFGHSVTGGFGVDFGSLVDEGYKPEGVPIELADVLIRIFDLAGCYEIDLAKALQAKLIYNRSRPHRHGGKAL